MKKVLLFAVVMMVGNFVRAQAPAIQWAKCYGGTCLDVATSIKQTIDGCFIVVGYTGSDDGDVTGHHGSINSSDYWVVKLDTTGTILWEKALGGINIETASTIEQTIDGGYIITGGATSYDGDVIGIHGGWDYWVVKLNAEGVIQWQKCLGGTKNEASTTIQQTKDKGYIVAGYSNSNDGDVSGHHGSIDTADCWVVKLDSLGNLQWQKSYGGTSSEEINSIQQTSDDGYISAGYSWSNNGDVSGHHGSIGIEDYWITKLDASGNIQWQKSLGGSGYDDAASIQQTFDGGFIVAGNSTSDDGDVVGHHGVLFNNDIWILKLNVNGAIQWQKSLGGTNGDVISTIKQTTDTGFIIAGASNSTDGDLTSNKGINDIWIAKINAIGTIQWQKSFGGSSDEWSSSIHQINNKDYIFSGTSYSNDGDVIGHHGNNSLPDYWVVKLTGTTSIEELPTSSISLSPNSTTGIITIKGIIQPTVTIYNLMGQKVVSAQGSNEVSLAHLPAGLYMVQVFSKDGELVKSEKVMKE